MNKNPRTRSMLDSLSLSLAAIGLSMPAQTSAAPPRPRRPLPSEIKDALQREIAEHNEAVERRRAEKKARR